MRVKSIFPFAVTVILFFMVSCTTQPPTDLTKTPFIPKPVSITATGKTFTFSGKTTISVDKELEKNGYYLAMQINKISGLILDVKVVEQAPKKGIFLTLAGKTDSGKEGYKLNIGKKLIVINANSVAGVFNGIQTLLQTLPVKAQVGEILTVATGEITDYPEFGFRGAMLDVARHFFNVGEVKQFIDFLATYKMNVLHLHLSDDQGWRIEIKSWPELTETGGKLEVGGGTGGFYSQGQYIELVNYAAERNITIIPEIDMPGHTNAALASYAELNCNGKARALYTGTEVGFSTLCTSKEVVYKFIDDVIRELAKITPGPYIHIGGDESHVTPMKDYIPFVDRVQKIVVSHGKKVIGWDEIANATPVEDATVQFWSNVKNTTMGVEKGAKVIMSPAARAYLDMKYDSTTTLGLHWAGYTEVDKAYSWDPATMVPGVGNENIRGVEAALWSETVTNISEVEYMIFPRLPGIAEIGWTSPDKRDWNEYKLRLAKYGKRFEEQGINFYHSPKVPWEE